MNSTGVKRASKWRRYLNIILGISNNKQPRKNSIAARLASDPSSTPKDLPVSRIHNDGLAATNTTNETGALLYCAR